MYTSVYVCKWCYVVAICCKDKSIELTCTKAPLLLTVLCSEVARVIVEHEGWEECLRACTRQDGVENTPFRRMIRKMPGTIVCMCLKYTHTWLEFDLHCRVVYCMCTCAWDFIFTNCIMCNEGVHVNS